MLEYNSTQLDKLSEKMTNEVNEKEIQALEFLYEREIRNIFCNVALINVRTILSDGSCLLGKTNLAEIFVCFKKASSFPNYLIRGISDPKFIYEETEKVLLVVLLVSTLQKYDALYFNEMNLISYQKIVEILNNSGEQIQFFFSCRRK